MLKMIYLAKRKPGFSFDGFIRRWRQHGALGMSQPIWRYALGYVQAEPVIPAPIKGASEDYDAIACFMMQDEMFSGMTEEDMAGAVIMAEDELKTFAEPIPNVALWVQEDVIKAGELGGKTAFLFFEQASVAQAVADSAGAINALNRVTLNRIDSKMGDMNTLPYQAVVELSAPTLSVLTQALEPQLQNTLAKSDVTVVAREGVFWDRMPV